eukprot:1077165-Prymnesium_polylepis.1
MHTSSCQTAQAPRPRISIAASSRAWYHARCTPTCSSRTRIDATTYTNHASALHAMVPNH